jgi:hypothetical protein
LNVRARDHPTNGRAPRREERGRQEQARSEYGAYTDEKQMIIETKKLFELCGEIQTTQMN